MKRLDIITLAVLILSMLISVSHCVKLSLENTRLSRNQRSLMQSVSFYRTSDSLSAASVEALTLSKDELKRYCSELEKDVRSLNVKVKRLQSVSQNATRTEYVIQTEVRDSLVYVASSQQLDTLQCMDYADSYLSFSGCIENGAFSGQITSRDTLVQVVHRIPRRFLFFRFGTKAIRQDVMSKNPHSTVEYSRYIELKR